MLTFIISMRARALSKNWAHHTWLLERTVDSILAQTNRAFVHAIICIAPCARDVHTGVGLPILAAIIPADRCLGAA